LAALPALSAQGAQMQWWNGDWEYRRVARVYARPSGFPGEDVAWVEFTGGGMVKPDGSDIRVVVRRQVVPHRVLFVGAGGKVTLAFKVVPGQQYYQIYFGNAKAEAGEGEWEIKRGCLLETRVFQGGNPNSWNGMQGIVKRAERVMGRAFVPRIFYGHNQFGPSLNNVNVFTGWLICPTTGKYIFVTSSDDASFLLVDGKMVVSWPGWHGAVRDIRHKGSVELTAGVHKLEYYHVQGGGGGQYMVAAWQPPGAKAVAVIPEGAFTPVYRATLLAFGSKDRPGGLADFFATNAGEALLTGSANYLIRMKFDNWTPPALRASSRCEWDFGDGNSRTAISPEHVYLSRGTYTVRLAVGTRGNSFEAPVVVDRDWKVGQISRQIDSVEDYGRLIEKYNWEAMPAADVRNGMLLYERLKRDEKVMELGRALLEPARDLPERMRADVSRELAELYVKSGQAAEASQVLHDAATMITTSTLSAPLLLRAGEIEYEDLRDMAKARSSFTQIVDRFSDVGGKVVRRAYIGVGDATRAMFRHESEKAFKESAGFYEQAMKVKVEDTTLRRERLMIAVASRAVDDYVRRGEFETAREYLYDWKLRSPMDVLEGNWSVSYARYLFARGKVNQGIDELQLLIDVNPKSTYAAPALVQQAEGYLLLDNVAEAKQTLEVLAEDYPESKLASRVDEVFRELERRVRAAKAAQDGSGGGK